MSRLSLVLKSSVVLKALMALSGLVMMGFLIGHLGGNLLIYMGKNVLNSYAAKLHSMGGLLWAVRIGLLSSLVVHVFTAITLTRRHRRSRYQSYKVKSAMASSFASRQMALTGSLVGLYVIFHLGHFTFKWTHPEFKHNPGDVYEMMVTSFQNPFLVGVYVVAMIMIGAHLYHGIRSAFASLGFYHPFYSKWIGYGSVALCVVLVLGFSSVPLAVYFGFVV